MVIALILARLLLVGVFALAGLTKLVDRAGSRQTMVDFGVPTAWAPVGMTPTMVDSAGPAEIRPAVGCPTWAPLRVTLRVMEMFSE